MSAEWRRVLRAVRSARDSAFLGPRTSARAAAAELSDTPWGVRLAVAAVLASQGAKNEYLTEVDSLWRELEADDRFRAEMSASRSPTVRRFPTRQGRRDPLWVETARAVPILDLFDRYGYKVRRAGVEWVTRCPFHDDRRPSLRLNPRKQTWYCDVCASGGDGLAFVMRLKGIDFAGAVREVAA
jgi:hypothetical protein